RGDYDPAIRLAEEALAIDPEFIEACGFIGVCHARMGGYPQAETAHRRQESEAAARGDARLLVEAYANLGVMHYLRGQYDEAHDHYRRAITAAGDAMPLELAQINNNLGFVLIRLGRAEEAEQAFLRSIETHRAYGALVSLICPYNGLGTVLLEQKRY